MAMQSTALFMLVLAATAACALAARPAAIDACEDAYYSNGTILHFCPCVSKSQDWQPCMSRLLRLYREVHCADCNVMIYAYKEDGLGVYVMSPKTEQPTNVVLREDVHISSYNKIFHIIVFHGPAYFETQKWYGWYNWAFTGNFQHPDKSFWVRFF